MRFAGLTSGLSDAVVRAFSNGSLGLVANRKLPAGPLHIRVSGNRSSLFGVPERLAVQFEFRQPKTALAFGC